VRQESWNKKRLTSEIKSRLKEDLTISQLIKINSFIAGISIGNKEEGKK
jgi:hypothetical protein